MQFEIIATPKKYPFETRKHYAKRINDETKKLYEAFDIYNDTTDIQIISDIDSGTPKYIIFKW